MSAKTADIEVPITVNVHSAKEFTTGKKVRFSSLGKGRNGISLHLGNVPEVTDFIVELDTERPKR